MGVGIVLRIPKLLGLALFFYPFLEIPDDVIGVFFYFCDNEIDCLDGIAVIGRLIDTIHITPFGIFFDVEIFAKQAKMIAVEINILSALNKADFLSF